MANFMSNLFPSRNDKQESMLATPPPLITRNSQNDYFNGGQSTQNRNSFITPVQTPQGSPSKKTAPPGANDLPTAFENAMKLNATGMTFGSPSKVNRQQVATPLSPGKSNALPVDTSYFGDVSENVEQSVLHKSAVSPGSPLRKQGKENTPPSARLPLEPAPQHNQAAQSRQELYQPREASSVRKFNTQRGLTTEELEILQKPNVKRLANVTQLCKFSGKIV